MHEAWAAEDGCYTSLCLSSTSLLFCFTGTLQCYTVGTWAGVLATISGVFFFLFCFQPFLLSRGLTDSIYIPFRSYLGVGGACGRILSIWLISLTAGVLFVRVEEEIPIFGAAMFGAPFTECLRLHFFTGPFLLSRGGIRREGGNIGVEILSPGLSWLPCLVQIPLN